MNAAVIRIVEVFRFGSAMSWLIGALGLVALTTAIAFATWLGMLPIALAGIAAAILTIACLRWPLLSLALFVALIPIEDVVVVDGLGTISKFAGILFAISYGVSRIGRMPFRAMPVAAWSYVAWSVVSLGWAIDAGTSWGQLATLLQLFVIAVLVADVVIRQPSLVRPILWIYSVSAMATAVVGIRTFIALGPSAEARSVAIEGQDPAQFAAILLPALIFGLYEATSGERRLLGGMVALLTAAGVVVSGTRGAWFSVAVVVAVFLLPRLSRRRLVSTIALMSILGVLTLQIPGVSDLVVQRAGTALASGGSGRTDIWTVGATIYGSAPLLGVGYAGFPVAYTSSAVGASDVTQRIATGEGSGPHNLVVGTLVELGPVGLMFLALFLVPLVLQRGWGPDAATVQAILASLLMMAMFLDILANRKQVWLVIGIAAGLAYLRRAGARLAHDADPACRGDGAPSPELPSAIVQRA